MRIKAGEGGGGSSGGDGFSISEVRRVQMVWIDDVEDRSE